MTIPGVGPMTAAQFVLAVDDVERFNKSKSVAAYFGLTPKRYQSGDMILTGASQNGVIRLYGITCMKRRIF
jgi:transposase